MGIPVLVKGALPYVLMTRDCMQKRDCAFITLSGVCTIRLRSYKSISKLTTIVVSVFAHHKKVSDYFAYTRCLGCI
jgi:hypothetical protein